MSISALTVFETAIAAATLCAALQPVVIALLRHHAILDHPNARSSHANPTPRGGGIALMCGFLGGVSLSSQNIGGAATMLLAASLLCALLGLAEDVWGVPAILRLVAQFAIMVSVAVDLGPSWPLPPFVIELATTLFLVAVVNAVNFMDGINGISAGQGAISGAAFIALGAAHDQHGIILVASAMVGTCLGFAPYNLPKARVFLGDSGSYGLGAVQGVLAVWVWADRFPWECGVAPLALYLADTGSTLVRRVRARESINEPHRQHTYQRLVDAGWSHTRVTGVFCVLTAACAALSAAAFQGIAVRIAGDAALSAIVTFYILLPRLARRASGFT